MDQSTRAGALPARLALAALALATLLPALGTSSAAVGLPAMAAAFGATAQQAQWVIVSYLVSITALVLPAGRIGDRIGRRLLLLAGIAVFTTGAAMASIASSLAWLIAARAIQGAGAAAMMALTLAFVAQAVPPSRSGAAIGLLGAMSAAGTALGPALGGLLIATGGWRALFIVNLPFGLLALLLACRALPSNASRNATGTAFPVAARTLLGDPGLRAGLAMIVIVATVLMATLVAGPFYLSRELGLDPLLVGLAMSVGPLVATACGVPAGRAVDRYGAPRMTSIGLTVLACGCAAMALLPPGAGVAGYLAALVLITAGYALFQAANNTAVMASAGPSQRGAVSGLLNLARNLGLMAGASGMGALFAWSGLQLTFALATVFALGALCLSLPLRAGRRQSP